MKKENVKNPQMGDPTEEYDELRIDVHDDDVMREMGFFRPFNQKPRDPSVWTKTPYERKLLRKMKASTPKGDSHFHNSPIKHIPIRAKLIIQLYKNDIFDKTTYSTTCWQHEIPFILSNYMVTDKKTGYAESAVRWYNWNGRKYLRRELPFWE